MATVTAYTPFNSDTLEIIPLVRQHLTSASSTEIIYWDGIHAQFWSGTGFTFGVNFSVTSGIVTGLEQVGEGDYLEYEVTGLFHSTGNIVESLLDEGSQGVLAYLFIGDDTFTGSP